MPRLSFAVLFAALVSTLSACGKSNEPEKNWSTAVATRPSDGHRIVYRFRSAFPPGFQRARLPDRVIIAWTYKSDGGLPSKAEFQSMNELEDLLSPYVEQPALADLVMVSTGDGVREWVYYTRSRDEFMAKANAALRDRPRFPVEIRLWTDPRWKYYEDFRRSLPK